MIFSRKPAFCAICNKQLTHRHKPKREWNIKGLLCGDCHVTKTKEFYEGAMRQNCVACGVKKKITDLWEPRWQWDMEGLLCKNCFDKKEQDFNRKKEFCCVCGKKLSTKFIFSGYNPKPKWKLEGKLCRDCWDTKKAQNG